MQMTAPLLLPLQDTPAAVHCVLLPTCRSLPGVFTVRVTLGLPLKAVTLSRNCPGLGCASSSPGGTLIQPSLLAGLLNSSFCTAAGGSCTDMPGSHSDLQRQRGRSTQAGMLSAWRV
jgi:hypothetical protein